MALINFIAVGIVLVVIAATPAEAAFLNTQVNGLVSANQKTLPLSALYAVPTLQTWKILKDGSLVGIVSNHPSLRDGELLTTSPLVVPEAAAEGVVVQTRTGAIYKLAGHASAAAVGKTDMGTLLNARTALAVGMIVTNYAGRWENAVLQFAAPMLTTDSNSNIISNMIGPQYTQAELDVKVQQEFMLERAQAKLEFIWERAEAALNMAPLVGALTETTKAAADHVTKVTAMSATSSLMESIVKAATKSSIEPPKSFSQATEFVNVEPTTAMALASSAAALSLAAASSLRLRASPSKGASVSKSTSSPVGSYLDVISSSSPTPTKSSTKTPNAASSSSPGGSYLESLNGATMPTIMWPSAAAVMKTAAAAGPTNAVVASTNAYSASPKMNMIDSKTSSMTNSDVATPPTTSSFSAPGALALDAMTSTATPVPINEPVALSKMDHPKREVIERIKTELELANEFFAHNFVIQSAPRPVASRSDAVILKGARVKAASPVTLMSSFSVSQVPSVDTAFSAATSVPMNDPVAPSTVHHPKSEVIERLETELELAHEFFSQNLVIKPAPRPIPCRRVEAMTPVKPMSSSSALEGSSFDHMSVADASKATLSSAGSYIDTISSSWSSSPPAKATTNTPAASSSSGGSYLESLKGAAMPATAGPSAAAVQKQPVTAGPTVTAVASTAPPSISTMTNMVDSTAIGAFKSSGSEDVVIEPCPKGKVIERTKTELELANEFLAQNSVIKPAPLPVTPRSDTVVSKSAGVDTTTPGGPINSISPPKASFFDAMPVQMNESVVPFKVETPKSQVIDRTKTELEIANEFFEQNTVVERAPHPIPDVLVEPSAAGLKREMVEQRKSELELDDTTHDVRIPPKAVVARLSNEIDIANAWKARNGVYIPKEIPPIEASSCTASKSADTVSSGDERDGWN